MKKRLLTMVCLFTVGFMHLLASAQTLGETDNRGAGRSMPAQGALGGADEAASPLNPNLEIKKNQLTNNPSSSDMPEWIQNAILGEEPEDDAHIRQGDVLDFHVYPQEELSSTKTVDRDGMIFFPYIGRVKVDGMLIEDVERTLTDKLKEKYFKNPRVLLEKQSSSIEKWLGWWKEAIVKPINIVGEVTYPGNYYIPRDDVTLIEAISSRQSFTKEADFRRVRVIRKNLDGDNQEVIYVDAKDIIDGKTPDFILKRGDTIVVPRKEAATVSIMGEVRLPVNVPVYEDGKISLMEAVNTNQGFTREADVNAIRVNRVVNGKHETFIVNGGEILQGKAPDVPLQQGDIVFVPQGGKVIHVLGEVNKPGPLQIGLYGDDLTLTQAISLAGDFTRIANTNKVRIIRNMDGKPVITIAKVGKILKGKENDIPLEPGDTVVVPESFW